jgi:hypothetical protein
MNFSALLLPLKNQIEGFFKTSSFASLSLPDDFRQMQAHVNGEPVVMYSYAWQSELFRYVRLTYLTSPGRIEMLNLTVYPQEQYDIPIFATDLVVLNQRLRVAVIDAMPLFPDEPTYWEQWVAPFEPLHRQSLVLASAYDRKLDWSFHYLGPFACLATQLPAENFAALFSLWSAYFRLYTHLAASSTAVSAARMELVRNWHQSYNDEHAAVESKRNPLIHYFGQELGLRYIHEFLFINHIG